MTIDSAEALWKALDIPGRFYPETHDKPLFAHLDQALAIPAGMRISAFLATHPVPLEKLLAALLKGLQPFGKMLSDIFTMFCAHRVVNSNDQLLMRFDFGESANFDFDVGHFRKAQLLISNVQAYVNEYSFSAVDLNNIAKAILIRLMNDNKVAFGLAPPAGSHTPAGASSLRIGVRNQISDLVAQQWADQSWPYSSPLPLPVWSADDPLKRALAPFIKVVKDVCERAGADYANADQLDKVRVQGTLYPSKRQPVSLWSEAGFAAVMDDHPAKSHWLPVIWHAHCLTRSDQRQREALSREIETLIASNADISNTPSSSNAAQAIQDLLDLPLWKKREQVYSIWLTTLLCAETTSKGGAFRLAGNNGTLEFAFRPTHVADLTVDDTRFKLIAEFKQPAGCALLGEGRELNIQPDYTVFTDPVASPPRACYVMEAKQYATAKTLDFNYALRDYAAVHKEAHVALVNYGAITRTQPAKLSKLSKAVNDLNVHQRCTAFANVAPHQRLPQAEVRKHFWATLDVWARDTLRLVVDDSESMKKRLNACVDWSTRARQLADIGMPAILAHHPQKLYAAGSKTLVLLLGLEAKCDQGMTQILDTVLDTQALTCIYLTDNEGFMETSTYHDNLGGLIVLEENGDIRLHAHAKNEMWFRSKFFMWHQELDGLATYGHQVGA